MIASQKLDVYLLLCLRLGTFMCFAGWAWQHLYWEGPYSALLWHDQTYELAGGLGIGWDEFVGSGANDGLVQRWVNRIGWLYVACAVISLTVRDRSWFQMVALVAGSVLLTIASYAKYLGSYCELPMFVEHGGQILMPIVLVLAIGLGVRHRVTVVTALAAVITTFAGHGSYAVDWWPTPANFYAMLTVLFRLEYETAKTVLHIAGVLDFVVCVGILAPFMRRASALYATAWGLLTALARPAAGMSTSLNYWAADQFIHEAVLRAPHFLIPLYLFLLWQRSEPRQDEMDDFSSQDTTADDPRDVLDYTTGATKQQRGN